MIIAVFLITWKNLCIHVSLTFDIAGRKMTLLTNPVIKTENGFLLCHPASDTVFLYDKNKVLTPIIHKVPLVKNLNPIVIMNNCLDYREYQFIEIATAKFVPKFMPASG